MLGGCAMTLALIFLASLGLFVLAQALRHALDSGLSWTSLLHELRVRLG
jgi:hypothetical protein